MSSFKPRAPSNRKSQKRQRGDVVLPSKHSQSLAEELDDQNSLLPKTRTAKLRKCQDAEEFVAPAISSKILAVAREQQMEIERENRGEDDGIATARQAFSSIAHDLSSEDDDDDDDEKLSDTESQYDDFNEIQEDEEKILGMFMPEKAGPQRTLADIIIERIKEDNPDMALAGERPVPALDDKIIEVYRGVGKFLSRFRSGKVPKAFKVLPRLSKWEEILYLTEPENWTANAMYQATRLFASSLNAKMAQRFYNLVLLPRVREDIRVNKRLHFALYQSLKKAVYKPSAFFKGILLTLCQSRTCNLREAVILGSVLQKVSIPSLHSSAALLKIAEMEYFGTNSYLMKVLLEKKYSLPYKVLDGIVSHFMRFLDDERTMPVIWHQCLLSFVQRYKNELSKGGKDNLERLIRHHKHYLVTPEIKRELQHSSDRGVSVSRAAPVSVLNAQLDEDKWNLPEVPVVMEE